MAESTTSLALIPSNDPNEIQPPSHVHAYHYDKTSRTTLAHSHSHATLFDSTPEFTSRHVGGLAHSQSHATLLDKTPAFVPRHPNRISEYETPSQSHATLDKTPEISRTPSSEIPSPAPEKHSGSFFDRTPERAAARGTYFKIFFGGVTLVVILIFTFFVIFWGANAKSPAHNLPGWIVDFDGGVVGQEVTQGLRSQTNLITWSVVPAAGFPSGVQDVAHAVMEQHTWVAVTINQGSTARWLSSLASPNASYSGADAVSVLAAEARNEDAYIDMIIPSIQPPLDAISRSFALQTAQSLSNSSSLSSILSISPQTIVEPISYTLVNLAPFDIPVASVVTFIGLIYQIIVSFFVVMVASGARTASGVERSLSMRSLMALRFGSIFGSFFIISLFYSLLSMMFQLRFSEDYGRAGFVIFWMLNYCGMLAVGLVLESMITLLTMRFIPFFMLVWILVNISACVFPIQAMPYFYRYGYAMPLYSISIAMLSVIFGTKNTIGLSFGVLFGWIVLSCSTLPFIQWFMRRERRPPSPPPQALPEAKLNTA